MNELLDAAIEEIGRVLIGNKDRNTEEVYLKNAIRHIREYGSQPQLNENQQIVLEWLKNLYGCHYYQPFVAVSLFRHSFWTEKIEENYNQLDRKQQAQVLEVFSRWAQEQEEE